MITDTKAPGGASLVIDRAKWLRGDTEISRLLNAAGRMCCLGFFGCSLGLAAEELAPYRTPSAHARHNRERAVWPEWLFRSDGFASNDGASLMGDNDDDQLTEQEREHRIASIFAKHGVTVTFIDGDSQ